MQCFRSILHKNNDFSTRTRVSPPVEYCLRGRKYSVVSFVTYRFMIQIPRLELVTLFETIIYLYQPCRDTK